MKKILLAFALTAAVMTAGAQVKELEPVYIEELTDPVVYAKQLQEAAECEECPASGKSGHDCHFVTNIKASSHLAPQGKNNYDEKNLYDDNYFTPWVEGVKGYGIGEKVTLTVEIDYITIGGITITNGYSKSQTAWKNNSRVKKLKFSYNGQEMFILNLKDQMGEQSFAFGKDLNFDGKELTKKFTITLEILDVYKGDKYDDTAISEISFGGCL